MDLNKQWLCTEHSNIVVPAGISYTCPNTMISLFQVFKTLKPCKTKQMEEAFFFSLWK